MTFTLRRAASCQVLALSLSMLAAGEASAQSVRVPGTEVSLTPPPGFQLAQRFSGFERPDAGASIVVTEMAAPVDQVAAGWTPQAAAQQGMTITASEDVIIAGTRARLFNVSQTASGTQFRRWILLMGDRTKTVLVTASVPRQFSDDSLIRSGVRS
jgi:hypothetical protein